MSTTNVGDLSSLLRDLILTSAMWSILGMSELRSCVKIKVAILGSPSPIVLMVSVDVKQH